MANDIPLSVGLVGLGTVGTGVAKVLLGSRDRIARRAGRPIAVRRIVVKDTTRPRAVELPEGVLTDDLQAIIQDPEIEVAVHLVGGMEPALGILLSLLDAGKHVVTANKAILCEHGDEIFACARKNNRCVAFEAAVGGGIPILGTIGQAMTANQILSIEAILNGTTNFILTEMVSHDRSYKKALKLAQELGYAEPDPTMDVDGTDAAQKLGILTQLAFGTKVSLSSFPRKGVDKLDLIDLKFAHELGYTVKLLAVVRLVDGQLEMHVQPTFVRRDRPLAKVDGAFNMIALEGDIVGKTWYSGMGAGQMPTASAVVADLIDVAVGRAQLTFSRLDIWGDGPALPVQPAADVSRRYYLRFQVEDRPHVLADIADILGRNGISLASVIQHESPELEEAKVGEKPIVSLVIMTHRSKEGQLRNADRELDRLATLRPNRVRMPVAD